MNPKEKEEIDARLRIATETLYDDYKNDKELTAFTVLDEEDFWNELTPEVQNEIRQGIAELDRGEKVSLESVLKEFDLAPPH